ANSQALLPEQKLRRDSREDRIARELRGGEHLCAAFPRAGFDFRHGLERDGAGWTGNHALAALDTSAFTHRVIQIKGDPLARSFAGSTDHIVFHHVIASAHATVTKNARAVIHQEHRRRRIELPSSRAWSSGFRE